MKDNDIVITSAFRSPIGTYKGSLSGLSAVELGSKVIEKCLKDSNLGPDDVDTLYMGQVLQTGSGQTITTTTLTLAGGVDATSDAKVLLGTML